MNPDREVKTMNVMRTLALLMAGICIMGIAWVGPVESDTKHPGFADVDLSQLFGKAKPNVSLDLDKQMLQMASNFFGAGAELDEGVNDGKRTALEQTREKMWMTRFRGANRHGEFNATARKIDFVRVRTFDLSKKQSKLAVKAMPDLKAELEEKNWQRIVLVEETDETVVIYFKPDAQISGPAPAQKDKDGGGVQGILILVIEPGEGIFVNLAGTLDLDILNQLTEAFHGGAHARRGDAHARRTRPGSRIR